MNYVAHLYLTYPDPSLSMGNLLGDMITLRESRELESDLLEGVLLHRLIDSTTDQHPEVTAMKRFLRPKHGKYSPVVLDILFDFVLVNNWQQFSGISYDTFQDWAYVVIADMEECAPERVRPRLQRMAMHQWLEDYRSRRGLEKILGFMDRRAKFNSHFARGAEDLDLYEDRMLGALHVLLGELRIAIEAKYPSLRNATRS